MTAPTGSDRLAPNYGRFRLETPMIRSMTGFARRERQYPWGQLAWELKTVNHRYLEVGCRLPEEFRAAEADFRQAVSSAVRRGEGGGAPHFRAAAGPGRPRLDARGLAPL